jgi:hypothetical protein
MNLPEVFYGLAANLHDSLEIDGILSALSRTECDRKKEHVFFRVHHENRQKYI